MKKHLLVICIIITGLTQGWTQFKKPIEFSSTVGQVSKPRIHMPDFQNNEPRLQQIKPLTIHPFASFHDSSSLSPTLILEGEGSRYPKIVQLDQVPKNFDHYTLESMEQFVNKLYGHYRPLELQLKNVSQSTDEFGNAHIKYATFYRGVPIYLGELQVHSYKDKIIVQGVVGTPVSDIKPSFTNSEAKNRADVYYKVSFGKDPQSESVKPTWSFETPELFYYFDAQESKWQLVYKIDVSNTFGDHREILIDAVNGNTVIEFTKICNFHNHLNKNQDRHEDCNEIKMNNHASCETESLPPDGPETSSGRDLLNAQKTIQVWREGNAQYMIDASKQMFKVNSNVLNNPEGAIVTADYNSGQGFIIQSANGTWPASAISAHANANILYDYFLSIHGRNSFNGNGSTILSFINVPDPATGRLQYDNAFWNGRFISYGNGDVAVNKPFSAALDIVAHELTHGVVSTTAELVYMGESGALNESFADVFGVMVDRADWGLGEDISSRNYYPTGLTRNFIDPHNGGSSFNDNGYQPKHVNEQYHGSEDNGGVHINSGITNHAFYLFVQDIGAGNEEQGKKLAEKIYYKALTTYLTRSSNFKDLRFAVEQSIKDIHGANSSILAAAGRAFDRVGIFGQGGGGGNNHQKDYTINPGPQYVVIVGNNNTGINLLDVSRNQVFLISNQRVISKPSVTDNGSAMVFVNDRKQIIALVLNQNGIYEEIIVDNQGIYRNAVLSKQGDLLAYLLDAQENKIHVFNFNTNTTKAFDLTNPTTSGNNLNNVKYADYLEFDHTGQIIMYDCLSTISKSNGSIFDYWDIGFINVFSRSTSTYESGQIVKLFQDLPENFSIGNPVFSKNSPYIIAFDVLDGTSGTLVYSIYGANIETSDLKQIIQNMPGLGFPNYSVDDKKLIFDNLSNVAQSKLSIVSLSTDKITPSSNVSTFVNNGRWGHWMAVGDRVLIGTETEKETDLHVFIAPNPASTNAYLNIQTLNEDVMNISISNMSGNIIHFMDELKLKQGESKIELDCATWGAGVYIIKLSNFQSQKLYKFVKL